MANRYWVGGSGNWDAADTSHWATTSGGASGASVPTSSDDVIFDSNSGTSATVTITGVTANANTIVINKSDLTLTHSGVGSTVVGEVTLTSGTLNTNDQTCNWGKFLSFNTNVRTLTMGSSSITLTGVGTPGQTWNTSTFTNLTVTANTSVVTLTGHNSTWFGGSGFNTNGGSIVMTGSGVATVANSFTCANLTRIGTASKTDTLQFNGGGTTITGTLTITGNSEVNRVQAQSLAVGTACIVSAGSVALSNVDFRDINASGAAIPWTGTSIGDSLGNNGNITFDTPTTQTRTGTGGDWSNAGNWTSRVPLPQDNVLIDSGASGTISTDMPRLGANIDFTGFTGTANFTTANAIFGNLTLASGMTVSGASNLTLAGRSSQTLNPNGKSFTQSLFIAAPGGSYTLQNNMTTVNFTLNGGTFTAGSYDVTAAAFLGSSTSGAITLNMGTGTWTMTSTATITIFGMGTGTVNPGTATIVIANASANVRTFQGTNQTFGTLTYTVAGSTGRLLLIGSNTFDTINFSDANNARTLRLTSGTTTTVTNDFNVQGTSGKPITLDSSSAGNAATLSKSSGIIMCDYLSIQDSTATGGASWYAGSNSTSVSGNSGWIFNNPSDFLQIF